MKTRSHTHIIIITPEDTGRRDEPAAVSFFLLLFIQFLPASFDAEKLDTKDSHRHRRAQRLLGRAHQFVYSIFILRFIEIYVFICWLISIQIYMLAAMDVIDFQKPIIFD